MKSNLKNQGLKKTSDRDVWKFQKWFFKISNSISYNSIGGNSLTGNSFSSLGIGNGAGIKPP